MHTLIGTSMPLTEVLEPHEYASIILRCQRASPSNLLYYQPYRNRVLRLNANGVVKFGPGVSQDETENQAQVHKIVDQRIVRVPRLFNWFRDDDGCGYLAMEFMEGQKAKSFTEPFQTESLFRVLQHFQSLEVKYHWTTE